jgi:hypothetical protein
VPMSDRDKQEVKELLRKLAEIIYTGERIAQVTQKLDNEEYLLKIVYKVTTVPKYKEFFSSLNAGQTDKAKSLHLMYMLIDVLDELFV